MARIWTNSRRRLIAALPLALLLAAPGPGAGQEAERFAAQYGHALRQAERALAAHLEDLPLAGERHGALRDWLAEHPQVQAGVAAARAFAMISAERPLEGGGLEVDLALPLRYLPAEALAQLDDPPRLLFATGTAPRRVRRAEPLDLVEFWNRRALLTTAYTGFAFTGLSRAEAEADAVARSRNEALSIMSRALPSLTPPDGRSLSRRIENAERSVSIPARAREQLLRTHVLVDRAEGSAEVGYELPLRPLAEARGLLSLAPPPEPPEAARQAARAAALADFSARIPVWTRDAEAQTWLRAHGSGLLSERDSRIAPDGRFAVVEMEITQKEIPDSIKNRLYADAWFPLLCRGYATR